MTTISKDVSIAKKYMNKYSNALSRKIEFTLTLADVRRLLNKKTCYYTWIKFDLQNTQTLDRIDCKKGYTKENTVVCCDFVNALKNSLFENENSKIKISHKNLMKILKKLPNNY